MSWFEEFENIIPSYLFVFLGWFRVEKVILVQCTTSKISNEMLV